MVLAGKPEGKRPLGRLRRRWEDNTKMDLQEAGCGGMAWINLSQESNGWQALINAVMNLWVPQTVGNFLTSSAYKEGLCSTKRVNTQVSGRMLTFMERK